MSSVKVDKVSVHGYPNYRIYSDGRCYNTKTNKFVGYENRSDGYVRVSFSGSNGIRVVLMHQLVIEHFGKPKPDGAYEIDHINRDRSDNRIENLRWVSHSENLKNRTSRKIRKP